MRISLIATTTALVTIALTMVISPIPLSARVDHSGFDDAKIVSDREISRDAKEVIMYCYDSLSDGFITLTKNDCDTSMVFFSYNCDAQPDLVPTSHYCASQSLVDILGGYLDDRGLEDEDDPGYYIPIST